MLGQSIHTVCELLLFLAKVAWKEDVTQECHPTKIKASGEERAGKALRGAGCNSASHARQG